MRLVAVLLCLLVAASVFAFPEFRDVYAKYYKLPGKVPCTVCHTTNNGGVRNLYGKQVQAQLKGSMTLTPAMLQAVEKEDADRDGTSNGDEIKSDRQPGVADAPTAPPPQPVAAPLVPAHSFHPLIVHFPIGIYLFAALVEFWGWRKKDLEMRRVALMGLWFGMLGSAAAVLSGIIAWLRMGLTLEGTLLIHLILGIAALALCLSVVLWRRDRVVVSAGYWTLLGLSVIAIGLTGHFGAMMVWQ